MSDSASGVGSLKERIRRLEAENEAVKEEIRQLKTRHKHRSGQSNKIADGERLRLALDAAEFGTFDYNTQTGEMIWDRHMKQIWGLDPSEELTVEQALARIHADDRRRVRNEMAIAMSPDGLGKYKIDFRVVLPGGSLRWHDANGQVYFENGPDGTRQPVRLIGVERDITEKKTFEKSLRDNEEQFRIIFERSAVGMVQVDPATRRFLRVNEAFCSLLGYSKDQLLQLTFGDITHPDDRDASVSKFQGFSRWEEESYQEEKRYLRPDGTIIFAHVTVNMIYGNDGKPWRTVAVIQDITDRKRAEDLLRESERRFRLFMDNAPAIAWIKDEMLRYVYVSKAYEQQLGVAFSQVKDKTDFELWDPETAEAFRKNDLQVMKTDQAILVEESRLGGDGTRSYWLNSKFPFSNGSGRRYIGGIGVNMTSRKKYEQELEESRRILVRERNLLKTVMDGTKNLHLVYLDRDFNFVRVNQAYAKTCGYTPDEMVGKNHFDLYPDSDIEAIFSLVRDTGEPIEVLDRKFEFPDQPERGTTYWDWTLNPVKDEDGLVVGLVFSLVETTERKKFADNLAIAKLTAEEASRAKSEFVANMSHEIRTPMTVFLSALDFLLTTESTPQQRKILLMADKAAKNLRNIIDDILDFSKIEARKFVVHKEPMDLRECVKDVVAMFALQVKEQNLKLKVNIAKDIATVIVSDPAAINQILVNLIGNALKFTDQGTIVVSASTQGGRTTLSVEDTGPGIPEEKLGEIFNSFCQADASFNRKHGGSGLGLAICKGLVGLLGGEITAQNRVGGGAVFTFTFPLEQPGESVRRNADSSTPKGKGAGVVDISILLVEDDPLIRDVISMALEERGWQVAVAADGKEAVESWRDGHFNIVLMDIQLPQMNGLEVASLIRSEEAPGGYTPIIGFTAHVGTGMRKKCLDVGMNRVLSKPVQLKELYRSVEHCLATCRP